MNIVVPVIGGAKIFRQDANKIDLIDLIEYGSHRDLIAKNGRYTSMYRQQGLSETVSTNYVSADKTLTKS